MHGLWDQPEVTHSYERPGTYTVTIEGLIRGWQFGVVEDGQLQGHRDAKKLVEIRQWGPLQFCADEAHFAGAQNLVVTATDVLDLRGTASLAHTFQGCLFLTTVPSMNGWDVSSITKMTEMFAGASSFNQDISAWDVSNVTDMSAMFEHAAVFNQDISVWDVANLCNMEAMFAGAAAFDQYIGAWNFSIVEDMSRIFEGATLSTANYDAVLIGWAARNVQKGVGFEAGDSAYSSGAPARARQKLIDEHGWKITDGGQAPTMHAATVSDGAEHAE